MSVHFGQSGGSRHVPVLPGSKARAPLRAPVAAPLPPPRHMDLPPASVPESVKPRRKPRHRAGRLLCILGMTGALAALAAGFLSRLYLSLDFQPEKPITEAGLRNNISVGIQYLGAWLAGNGCVPVYNLMEDAATAEISRSQIWQWMRSPKGLLEDGRKVTPELFKQLLGEELAKVKAGETEGKYDEAARLFERITTDDRYVEFLTLPAYQQID